jgi:ATP phosphoribosyltransferase
VRVSSEYPELTRRFFADNGIEADIRLSYGATEAKIPDIADCVVEITETGRALRAAGLKVIDTILRATPRWSPTRRGGRPREAQGDGSADDAAQRLLDARGRVMLKLNVSERARTPCSPCCRR